MTVLKPSNTREAPPEVWAEIDAELDKEFKACEDDLVECVKKLTAAQKTKFRKVKQKQTDKRAKSK
jgi:cytochrome c556